MKAWDSMGSISNRAIRLLFLKTQDRLLSQPDEHLPFTGHVFRLFQLFHSVQHLMAVLTMRPQEIVVSDPEGDVVVGAFKVVVTTGNPVR